MRKSYQVECEHSVSGNVTGHSRNGPLAPVGIKVDSATADNTNFHKNFVTPTPILCLFTKKYEQYTKHHARVILCEKKQDIKIASNNPEEKGSSRITAVSFALELSARHS